MRQVYGQQPVLGPRSAEATLIDVEADTGVSSLWELEMTPRPSGTYRLAVAELLYDDALTGRQEKITADALMEFTADALKSVREKTRVFSLRLKSPARLGLWTKPSWA